MKKFLPILPLILFILSNFIVTNLAHANHGATSSIRTTLLDRHPGFAGALKPRYGITPKAVDADGNPIPAWWLVDTGGHPVPPSQAGPCDRYNYQQAKGITSSVLTAWGGIEACGPLPGKDGKNDNPVWFDKSTDTAAQLEWECVELVARAYKEWYNLPSIRANGNNFVHNYWEKNRSMFNDVGNNAVPSVVPQPGDAMSYSTNHVVLVTDVYVDSNGNGILTFIEQNAASSGTNTQMIADWKVKGSVDDPQAYGPDTVTDWLAPKFHVVAPTSMPSNTMYTGVDGLSSNNVYITGEQLYWNGSTYATQLIAGRFDGSIFSQIPVDTPSDNEFFTGIIGDPNTPQGLWAFGVQDRTNLLESKPLFERYDRSSRRFVYVPVSLPVGSQAIYLAGGNFSGTTGWVVGSSMTSSGQGQEVFYFYDSTHQTWISYPGPIHSDNDYSLAGVVTLGSRNAWAVGSIYSYTSHLQEFLTEHFDGKKWSVVTQAYPMYDSELLSVSARSSSNIWAVGWNTSGFPDPTAHYNGSIWAPAPVVNQSPLIDVTNPGFTLQSISADPKTGAVIAVGDNCISTGFCFPIAESFSNNQWNLVPMEMASTFGSGMSAISLIPGAKTAFAVGYTIAGGYPVIEQLDF